MQPRFGGGMYVAQCRVCDGELNWKGAGSRPSDRIATAAMHHLPDCPARVIDPARLRRCSTSAEALALVHGQS